MRNKSTLLATLLLLTGFVTFAADAPKCTASAPSSVVVDRPFQIVYTVNASCKDIRVPEFNGFELLAGPFESHASSTQIINGKMSSSYSHSFTYTLQAKKPGTYNVNPATVTVDNQKVVSNGLSIKVLPPDQSSKSQSTQSGNSTSGSTQNSSRGANLSSESIFIRAEVSKTNVTEQEAVVVTYKLYTTLDVTGFQGMKVPDFNGFLKHDIELPQNKQLSVEHYNGKNYGTVVLYQALLYPQRPGAIEISKATFDAVVRVQSRAQVRSIFDDFFDSYTNVNKTLVAPALRVNVSPLPSNKPVGFSGAVGHFTMNSTITSDHVKENDAITIKLIISGVGNMKLINTPNIKFPDGFEVYDPKVANNFKTSANGISGTKTVEYMIIPRHSGDYEVPGVELAYFDINTKTYKTLHTLPYKIKVQKGEGGNDPVIGTYIGKEDVKQLGKDIRYIITDNVKPNKEEQAIFGTFVFWLMYLLPLILSGVLFIFFRKQVKESADVALVKNRKANKEAQKRLKMALKLLKEGNKDKFYEEVLKALSSYLSDKLNIAMAQLTKEVIQEELAGCSISDNDIQRVINILNQCEFARYAPNANQEMGNLYDETLSVISLIEAIVKH